MSEIVDFQFGFDDDNLPLPIDAASHWQDFLESDFADRLNQAASVFFWQVQIHFIDLPQAAKDKFWQGITAEGTEKARFTAVHGMKFVNNYDLFTLLADSIAVGNEPPCGHDADPSRNGRLQVIGFRFAEIAAKKDHRIFQRMAEIMSHGGIDGGIRGGEDSINGQVMRELCQFVATHRALPTKKHIRESLGLETYKTDSEKLRIAFKELGLSGLPQSR
jgi:hypothetical protein